jgi:hypothetical protein
MAIIEKKIFLVLEAGFAFETFVARQPVKDTSEVLEGFFAQCKIIPSPPQCLSRPSVGRPASVSCQACLFAGFVFSREEQ